MSSFGPVPPAVESRRTVLAAGAGALLGAGALAARGTAGTTSVVVRPAGTERIVDVHDYLDASMAPGPARDTAAWKAALAAAAVPDEGVAPEEHHAVVTAIGGSFTVEETLSWDTRVSIIGHCEIVNAGSGFLFRTVSPVVQKTAAGFTRQHQTVLSDIHLVGSGGSSGIAIGAAPHLRESGPKPAYLTLVNVVLRSFDIAVELGSHAYLLEFRSCSIQGNRIGVLATKEAVDAGERISIQSCDLTSNTQSAIEILGDQEFFVNQCSFDTFSTNQSRAALVELGQIYFTNCHFEMQIPDRNGWFELAGWGALLTLTDCRYLVRGRVEVRAEAERGLIEFSGAGGQRAVVRGGQFQGGTALLPFLARGDGVLTVEDTSALPRTALRPHAGERERGVLDASAARSSLADDWVASGEAEVTPVDSPVSGVRAFAVGDGSGEGAVHLFVGIKTGARVLVSLDALFSGAGSATVDLGFSTARRTEGLGQDWYSASRIVDSDSFAGIRLDGAYSIPAPDWAGFAVLRIRTGAMGPDDRLYLRDLRFSRL
ncbi:hypothetical protein [Rathayibacter sp. VKM Ac-2754]|uniref:hypothetical protein n=1 Tax=Rathayibacter sp. VKM Ac-2754 TaxID=2609251 RepID=UPI0013589053|nr:hypothetical protein [Rathayibacter sp. VKM Ac-2754]MWV57954.1 hypothetical protein [Rathayibacter sp. VKM Ac-2754]